MGASTGSSAGTAAAPSSTLPTDPAYRGDLLARKLAALVRARWGAVADAARPGSFPGGVALVSADGDGRSWAFLDSSDPVAAVRRLGSALALALRAGAGAIHVLTDDIDAAALVARRCALFEPAPATWLVEGASLRRADASPPAVELVLAPDAELYRPLLALAGLTPMMEGGVLRGELLGLEVARVEVGDDGVARLRPGVGRSDREAGALMRAELGEADALAQVRDLVAQQRHGGAERHPLNQLVPERWLRAVLVAEPGRFGAAALHPVASAVPRRNLQEKGVASAVGEDLDGQPIVVTCSTGVDLDLVPAAADDRLAHAPDARLILVVPERDAVAITQELAARLVSPAEVVTVADTWTNWGAPWSPERPDSPPVRGEG